MKFECKVCSKYYYYASNLKKHRQTHKNYNEGNKNAPKMEVYFIKVHNMKANQIIQQAVNPNILSPNPHLQIYPDNYLNCLNLSLPQHLLQLQFLQAQLASSNQPSNSQSYMNALSQLDPSNSSFPLQNTLNNYIMVSHNNHIDFLINSYLYYYDGNELQMHELEVSNGYPYDPYECRAIEEISHISSVQDLDSLYKRIEFELQGSVKYNQLVNQNNCNSVTCSCALMKEHPNWQNCKNNIFSKTLTQKTIPNSTPSDNQQIIIKSEQGIILIPEPHHNSNPLGLCLCNQTKPFQHKHGIGCGHLPIMHAGHTDYIVNGVLHFIHQDHCDTHGTILFVNQEFLEQQQLGNNSIKPSQNAVNQFNSNNFQNFFIFNQSQTK